MNYSQTIDYLISQLPVFHRIGAAAYKNNLDNTVELCKSLGNPEKKFKSIHIAGTNGKGSVANMLSSILFEAGYKTGLCTSPHLKDFRERIRINGKMIPKGYVVNFVKEHKRLFYKLKPSFFEMFIALTFDYFANEQPDIAVIETGMGGRLDSTNVILPEISVITNIGLDHTAFLGDTIEKIANEKAGIIKYGVPVVIGKKQKETKQVFDKKASELRSELFFAEDVCKIIRTKTIVIKGKYYLDITLMFEGETINFLSDQWGHYQNENIATNLAVISILKSNSDFRISKENIKNGLKNINKNTGFEGRWQLKGDSPRILFDTGHNVDGLNITMGSLNSLSFEKLHFVLGMVDDKDLKKILELLPKNAKYYFCKPNVPRGLNVDDLEETARKFTLKGNAFSSVKEAYNNALKNAGKNDLVFVGGSTFVVAEVI